MNALTNALGDCHRRVRRNAEKALCACGYEVVSPVCEPACDMHACAEGVPAYSPAAMPQPANSQEVAPPPPAEPKAPIYKGDASMHTVSSKRSLRNVFGLLR